MWGYDEENHNRQVLSIDLAPREGVNQLHPCAPSTAMAIRLERLHQTLSPVGYQMLHGATIEKWCSMKCRKMNSFNRSMCELILDWSCHTLQKLCTLCKTLLQVLHILEGVDATLITLTSDTLS